MFKFVKVKSHVSLSQPNLFPLFLMWDVIAVQRCPCVLAVLDPLELPIGLHGLDGTKNNVITGKEDKKRAIVTDEFVYFV